MLLKTYHCHTMFAVCHMVQQLSLSLSLSSVLPPHGAATAALGPRHFPQCWHPHFRRTLVQGSWSRSVLILAFLCMLVNLRSYEAALLCASTHPALCFQHSLMMSIMSFLDLMCFAPSLHFLSYPPPPCPSAVNDPSRLLIFYTHTSDLEAANISRAQDALVAVTMPDVDPTFLVPKVRLCRRWGLCLHLCKQYSLNLHPGQHCLRLQHVMPLVPSSHLKLKEVAAASRSLVPWPGLQVT